MRILTTLQPLSAGVLTRRLYDESVRTPREDTWVEVGPGSIPTATVTEWAVRPDCGAVVVFSGTARDHSPGRAGVRRLEYEAYKEQAEPRMRTVADEARARWPELGRVALLHRTGPLEIGETAVVAAVSAPHREEAFAAARFCIDTLKASVPLWKREVWDDGEAWGSDAEPITEVGPGR